MQEYSCVHHSKPEGPVVTDEQGQPAAGPTVQDVSRPVNLPGAMQTSTPAAVPNSDASRLQPQQQVGGHDPGQKTSEAPFDVQAQNLDSIVHSTPHPQVEHQSDTASMPPAV